MGAAPKVIPGLPLLALSIISIPNILIVLIILVISSFIKSLNHGLDPNIEINENKDRVIHLISRKNNLPMVKALFENDSKVDINVINKNNETPLITAIENKSEEIAVYLIKKKANISLRKKGDMSPLMLCCKFGQMDIVKLLINYTMKTYFYQINKHFFVIL